MAMMLGKNPPIVDDRTLRFVNYMPAVLPPPPESVRWDAIKGMSDWGMDGNDRYGNCVIVTAAHIIDAARANESAILDRISDTDVIALSNEMRALAGYYLLDRLKWWRNIGMFETKLHAFVALNSDHDIIRSAIHIFGHADVGLMMPSAWENSDVWDVGFGRAFKKGSWAGHSVPILGYEINGNTLYYYACTWGKIVLITAQAMDLYCDELYTSIVPDWFSLDRITPSGFDLGALQRDLMAVA